MTHGKQHNTNQSARMLLSCSTLARRGVEGDFAETVLGRTHLLLGHAGLGLRLDRHRHERIDAMMPKGPTASSAISRLTTVAWRCGMAAAGEKAPPPAPPGCSSTHATSRGPSPGGAPQASRPRRLANLRATTGCIGRWRLRRYLAPWAAPSLRRAGAQGAGTPIWRGRASPSHQRRPRRWVARGPASQARNWRSPSPRLPHGLRDQEPLLGGRGGNPELTDNECEHPGNAEEFRQAPCGQNAKDPRRPQKHGGHTPLHPFFVTRVPQGACQADTFRKGGNGKGQTNPSLYRLSRGNTRATRLLIQAIRQHRLQSREAPGTKP